MANYAIGDIQGCYQELILLLDKINFNSSEDRLWLCGDLVNRGPDSRKCLEFLHSIKQNCLITLGNHDLHLIALAEGVSELSKTDTLQDLLQSRSLDLYVNWLKQLPLIQADTLVLKGIKKADIIVDSSAYLYAEFSSSLFKFVDDVEFLKISGKPGIQIRSASRLGHSDLGVNRKRIEKIRTLLEEN